MRTLFTIVSIMFLDLATGQEIVNTILFERSKTGFLFTTISIDGKDVKAMIDFGDPGELMLSSSFVKEKNILTKQTSMKMLDVHGNEYILEEGEVSEVKIGNQKESSMRFLSAPGEIEKVGNLVNEDFDAVVGFGLISQQPFVLDYDAGRIEQYQTPSLPSGIVCEYDDTYGYLVIEGTVGDHDIAVLIDTGSSTSVLNSHFELEEAERQLMLDGEQIDVQLQLQDLTQLSGLADLVLGGDVLSNYRLHFDPDSKKVVFEEN